MKLVTFRGADGAERIGAALAGGTSIVDLAKGDALLGGEARWFGDMLALIDGGEAALDRAREIERSVAGRGMAEALQASSAVTLLAPVPVPRQMRDCLSFEKHLVQARAQRFRKLAAQSPDPDAAWRQFQDSGQMAIPQIWYDQPIYYKQNRFSVVGTGTDVLWPRYSKVMDYELEFGVFIGRTGKNISRDAARAHIFGYTIFNDFSARDAQAREMQGQLGPAKGKDFDTGNAMGPWLVTADEIATPYDLTMVARVNGEEWSRGNSGTMHHRFEDMIAHISADETLHAGEFIGSGTVGSGCGLELDRYLADGDLVELEIDGLGVLSNRVRVQP
ncbi:MAG: fumarylacetoacetate hydrolase family protein [Rhodospirillaceae bacterium]|nr:fumarylacetoacetate hydrolase family protein [Rhodospirillaceae bacterium]